MRQLKGIAKEMKSRWLLGVARVKKPECGVGRGVLCCCSEICCLPSALEGGKSRSRLSPELPLLVPVLGSWRGLVTLATRLTPAPQPHPLLPTLQDERTE